MANNTQFLRTDKAISSAFLHLLEKKPFEKITVQDILDATPVSRATFYKHYRDKYEIIERMQADLMMTYAELFDALSESTPDSFSLLVQQHGVRHQDTAKVLMQVRTEAVDLPRALEQEARTRYPAEPDSETGALEARIYGAAVSTFFIGLVEGGYDIQPEASGMVLRAVAHQLLALSNGGESK